MRIGRILLVGWNVLLVGFCLYLMFGVLDEGISLTHCYDGSRYVKQERDALRRVTLELAKGARQDDVRRLFIAKFGNDPDHLVKDQSDDIVVVDQVALKFRDRVLAGIVFSEEPSD
jgi:hypothetical protein